MQTQVWNPDSSKKEFLIESATVEVGAGKYLDQNSDLKQKNPNCCQKFN